MAVPAFYEKPVDGIDLDDLIFRNVDLVGVCGGGGTAPEVLTLLAAKRLRLDPMITHTFDLGEVSEAMAAMKERNAERIKIMLRVHGDAP